MQRPAVIPEAPRLGIAGQAVDQHPGPTDDVLGYPLAALSHCRYCWGKHPGVCPHIRSIMWHPNGQVARILLEERQSQKDAVIHLDDELPEAEIDSFERLHGVFERSMLAIQQAPTLKMARQIAAGVLEHLQAEAATE